MIFPPSFLFYFFFFHFSQISTYTNNKEGSACLELLQSLECLKITLRGMTAKAITMRKITEIDWTKIQTCMIRKMPIITRNWVNLSSLLRRSKTPDQKSDVFHHPGANTLIATMAHPPTTSSTITISETKLTPKPTAV